MPFKDSAGQNNPYLTALMVRCELSYLILILLIHIKGLSNNRYLPNKQSPLPILRQYPQGMTDKLPVSA